MSPTILEEGQVFRIRGSLYVTIKNVDLEEGEVTWRVNGFKKDASCSIYTFLRDKEIGQWTLLPLRERL